MAKKRKKYAIKYSLNPIDIKTEGFGFEKAWMYVERGRLWICYSHSKVGTRNIIIPYSKFLEEL